MECRRLYRWPLEMAAKRSKRGVTEAVEGAGAELAGGRAGERAVERVEFGEPPDVGGSVAAGERLPGGAATVDDLAGGPVLAQQAGDLGPRQVGRLGQGSGAAGPCRPWIARRSRTVVRSPPRTRRPRCGFAVEGRSPDSRRGIPEPDPGSAGGACRVARSSSDDPRLDARSGSLVVGNNPPFRLMCHWTRLTLVRVSTI